ncbi:SpaA isopeptide-forming pilin-related protein [Bifidobacterium porcinum]|uniref:SpaA isopeptide-forming pilin-related protein n=1 Tax=Bifidobacterium porcinum TaxID=212365 RepID=UPI00399368BE
MKMRTLFAGIVAAATMLGGMAAVATSAQAADVTITVNNSQSGHTYTPYKFANLKVDTNDTSKVEVTTVEGWSDAVKTAAGLDAAGNATDANKKLYASNPAAYVATFNAEQLRGFAQKLSATGKTADGTATSGTDGQSASIPVSGEGWYLVTDSFTKDGNPTTGINAIVATTINGRTGDFKIVGDAGTGHGNIQALGQFNAKNENAPQPPTKEVKLGTVDVNGKSASVGDTLSFTIKVPVPANAAGYDKYPFTIIDTASKGLKMPSTSEYKITDADKNDITSLFTITQKGDADGTATTFKVADPTNTPKYAGQTLVVTYNATVTEDAKNAGSVDNSATITTNNGVSGNGTTKVYNYGFSLTKKNKDGYPLEGAVFQLYDESGKSIGSQVSTGDNGDAAWSGLAAGTYTVKETKAPAGYSQQFLPTFKVTITQKQNDPAEATVTIEGDTFGLATESNGNITVLNVKNASQLPLTGAAGTAMFTVVALLVAAAGVTLAVKSRQRVH